MLDCQLGDGYMFVGSEETDSGVLEDGTERSQLGGRKGSG